jgi:WD40 repeat protein
MGVVYKARQVGLDRIVALKMLLAGGPVANAEALARFRSEAAAIARLQHPNIIQVHDIGTCAAGPYFAMEFAESGSLADHWDGSPQPMRPTAALVATLARAVHAAHERGVVHRDLKPANVLLSFCGGSQNCAGPHAGPFCEPPRNEAVPKITDFGLARRLDEVRALTLPGQVMGTPGYMAPEQARGPAEVGPAADVYALGVLLYEALTGMPPYRGTTAVEVVHLMLTQEALPPSRLRARLPRDLETICLHCLNKEPHKRYPTAAALAEDLERFLGGQPILARPTPRWERAWKWAQRQPGMAALAGAVVALTVLGFVLVTWQWRRAESEQQRTEAERLNAVHIAEAEAEARRQAQRLSTRLLLERGVSLCEAGDCPTGLLWLARSLESAPANDRALRRSLRLLLGGWGRQLHPLRWHVRHEDGVSAVAFHAEGQTVLTVAGDRVYRWDARTGKALGKPWRSPGQVLALLPRGGALVAVTRGPGEAVRLYSAESRSPLSPLLAHARQVQAVALSPDGSLLLTGGEDGKARLWRVSTGELVRELVGHEGPVLAVAFRGDGKAALTGGEDRKVRGWDVPSGKHQGTFRSHGGAVRALAFAPGDRLIASGGNDHSVMLWEPRTGSVRARLWHKHHVKALRFSPDGRLLATGSHDQTVRLWDVATGRAVGVPLLHNEDASAVCFSPDGKSLLTGSDDRTARVWQVADPSGHLATFRHPHSVISLAVSSDGRRMLTGCSDGKVRLWEVETGKERVLVSDVTAMSLAFSPDGRTFAVGEWEGLARCHDLRSGRVVGQPLGHGDSVRAVAYSPDGRYLLTGCEDDDPVVRVWDVSAARVVHTLTGHSRRISSVAFSPDGKRAASGSWDYRARLWDLRTGRLATEPLQHEDIVQSVRFSRDGRVVVTAGDDYTVRLWTPAGKPRGLPLKHPDKLHAAALSPDGTVLVSGGKGKVAHQWETATGKSLGTPLRHAGEIYSVVFLPNGKGVLTGSWDRTVRLWRAPAAWTEGVEAIKRRLHVQTGQRLDGTRGVVAVDAETWGRMVREKGR